MEKAKRSRRAIRPCPQQGRDVTRDVPVELIQYIQSLLPVKQAARTCLLSKSWLRAWSTIPTLRFQHESKRITDPKYRDPKYRKLISRTLRRYRRDNIPILSFNLHFDIHNQKAASLIDKCVRKVASKSCTLKELYLTLAVAFDISYKLPDEIFSSENLHTISATHDTGDATIIGGYKTGSLMWTSSSNVIISCVNLRVLELVKVHISEEALDKIFSTCILLEKINLMFRNVYTTLKVKNLRYLQELKIIPYKGRGILELSDVPSLRLFDFDSFYIVTGKRLWVSKDSFGSLRELFLTGDVIGKEFQDLFKSNNFPVLESLSLVFKSSKLRFLDISCTSLQRFVAQFRIKVEIDLQVCSPRLVFFSYTGKAMPGLSFPIIVPDQIVLRMELRNPVDHSFFFKMRETLDLSSNFEITIQCFKSFSTVPFNIDDIRIRVMSPATNVQKLTFDTGFLSDSSPLLDALFSICHPKYVEAYSRQMIPKVIAYLQKLITRRRVVEKKSQKDYYYYCWSHLKDVEVEDCGETMTWSWTSVIDRPVPSNWHCGLVKLTWCSPSSCSSPCVTTTGECSSPTVTTVTRESSPIYFYDSNY